jgi:hypothetical protein
MSLESGVNREYRRRENLGGLFRRKLTMNIVSRRANENYNT